MRTKNTKNARKTKSTKTDKVTKKQSPKKPLKQSEERLKSVLDLSTEWYWEQDENYRFILITGAGFGVTGIDPESYIGTLRWDHGAVPVGDGGSWDPHKAVLDAQQSFAGLLYWRIDPRGEVRYITASGQPVFDEKKRFLGYRGIGKDVTASKRAEQLLALEHTVNRALSEADSISDALKFIIRTVCGSQGWECGRYFYADSKAGLLRFGEAWGIPDAAIQNYIAASRDYTSPLDKGSKAGVWRTGEPRWSTEIMRGHVVRPTLGSTRDSFVFAVTADGKPLGVLSFTSRKVREPDARLLQAVRVIGSQIGQFLQRMQAEEALRTSVERFDRAVGVTNDIIWDWDIANDQHWRNENFATVFGYGAEETGTGIDFWRGCVRPEDRDRVQAGILTALGSTADNWSDEYQFRRHDGSYAHVLDRGQVIRDRSGRAVRMIGAMADITERKQDEDRIQYLATHDGLTSLPNRVLFNQVLNLTIQTARRYERKFAVFFIDLDRFKNVNDTLGHEAGDQLLKEIAERLTKCLRSSDVIARLGGDEFVVLVQETGVTEQVTMVARKILAAVMKPVVIRGQECWVTASVGICMYPVDAQDEQTLMKNADIAMYLAKEEGKNNFQFFSESIKIQSLERLTLETSLRHALDHNEFLLHYQAKLELKTKRITGVEALLRWQHPDHGVVPPARFIPVAEETGLIVPIGKWVLHTACSQNVAWQRQGLPPVCMAVNLSARQFADDNLLKDIVGALEKSGMSPELLELELTESMVMQNPEQTTKILTAIKQMGVRIAIDDFGVGYSSLAQIRRFPIDTLKVDRSFIRDLAANAEDRAITEAIISMGKSLSLTVVAEGVETLEQQNFLVDHSCDAMQGYYFSKPIEQDQFAKFLQEHLASSK